MKRALFSLTALLAFAFVAVAQGASRAPQAEKRLGVGAKLESFSLKDADDKEQTLDSLKGKNGSVLIFLSAQCPVVEGYKDRINQVAAEAKTKGINFIGINSNSTESKDWIKSNIKE